MKIYQFVDYYYYSKKINYDRVLLALEFLLVLILF